MMEMMKCEKCGNKTFEIEVSKDCDNCGYNGAYYKDEYVYNERIILKHGLERTEAEDMFECKMGANHMNGCHIYICLGCWSKTNLPFAY
ncbi:MAG: hypothetical protein GY836_22085 [Herbaspirillum sp.]|uniref:hypothetical protein n=1 Tax=Herbaspirillum sp. TaxID=1890675 RepID=UPI0025869878|nr:hypothetical protein [Herbaspirillum sp.]MCP4558102.1 hypothetical protein [Herbaspirillum sp.]